MFDREEILQKALALPADDRAYIATELERSLNESRSGPESEQSSSSGADAALMTELKRRSAAYRAGLTSARSATEVLADLQRRQASEQST